MTTTTYSRTRRTTDSNGRQLPLTAPWRVLCASHMNFVRASRDFGYEAESLEGDWVCCECAKFGPAQERELRDAIVHEDFVYTRTTGYYAHRGVVYHRNRKSPTGVFAEGPSFDPYCPAAKAAVERAKAEREDTLERNRKAKARREAERAS